MPAMPRPKGKATKIAYAILGKPANMTRQTPVKYSDPRRPILERGMYAGPINMPRYSI